MRVDTIDTALAVRVGRSGSKVHILRVSVRWDERKQEAAIYHGQTHCGSQRHMSGWSFVGIDTPITCERCGQRPTEDRDFATETYRFLIIADPTRVVTLPRGAYGHLTPTEWATEMVRPEEKA